MSQDTYLDELGHHRVGAQVNSRAHDYSRGMTGQRGDSRD